MDEQKTVFLAEDNPSIRRLYARAFNGCKVLEFESGEEVIDHMQRSNDIPDMLVTDNTMSGTMKGMELAKILRTAYPKMPIFFQTGDRADYSNLRKAGIDVFYKPVENMKLIVYGRTRLGRMPAKKILIADDQPVVHDLLSEGLTHKYHTSHYFNGLDAKERLHKPFEELNLEMAILDVNMPGMNGETLAYTTRQKHPKLPIVLYTGDGLSHYRFLEDMGVKLIHKSLDDAAELVEYVDGVLK